MNETPPPEVVGTVPARRRRLLLLPRDWSVRGKLLALVVVTAALPAAVGAALTLAHGQSMAEEAAAALLGARGDQLVTELDSFHREHLAAVVRLGYLPSLRQFVVAPAEAREAAEGSALSACAALVDNDPDLRSVVLLGSDGKILLTTNGRGRGTDLSFRSYVQEGLKGKQVISDVFVSVARRNEEPEALIAYAVPAYRAPGDLAGLLVAYLRADAFWRTITAFNDRAGTGSYAVVLDELGVRIAHGTRPDYLFRPAGPLPPDVVEQMIAERRFGDNTRAYLERVLDRPEQFALARAPTLGQQRLQRYLADATEKLSLAEARRLTTVPWTVVVRVPEEVVMGPPRRLTLKLLLLGAVGSLLAVVLGLGLSRRLLRPIRGLLAATERVARGDLAARVAIRGADELGQLGERFNEMAAAIETGNERLESRVKSRTRELERANVELGTQKEELLVQQAELASSQHELQLKNEEVQRANRLKSEFLANMSHELRTPLNSIIGFSELLGEDLRTSLAPRHLEYLDDVMQSGRHLLSLINDILDLSKIEAGHLSLSLESIGAEEAVAEACEMVRPAAGKKRITLLVEVKARQRVRADRAKLRQVLLNLLSNAIKFNPEDAPIQIAVSDGPGVVRIAVRDRGPGIAPALRPRLFDPFVQGEDPLVKKHQGTGLGLAISKRIVEQHGGDIEVDSAPGKGATMTVTFPAAIGTGVNRVIGDAARDPTGEHTRPVVLLAEEHAEAQALRLGLEESGYLVEELGGRDVVAAARALQPMAIVIDPARDSDQGVLAVDRLQRDADTRDIPLVASTAPGAGFVPKPVSTAELLGRVHTLAPPAGGHRVLVVEDDRAAGALLCAMLSPAGYRVEVIECGREGIAAAVAAPPALVVVDLLLPDISGFEVIEALASDPRTVQVPVLVLTGSDLTDFDRARLRQRVTAVAGKGDLLRGELIAAVDRATGRRTSEKAAGPTILVVDDHDLNRQLARAILERKGYVVAEAEDGQAAVEMALRTRPALILMDLAMPRKDGYTAARELKAEPSTAEVPIVALTALAMRGDEAKALAAGIDAYLTKPIDRAALEATVDRFLGQGPRA
jgi:signal transduction histidine kinase/CheY-like chemotaxis protein